MIRENSPTAAEKLAIDDRRKATVLASVEGPAWMIREQCAAIADAEGQPGVAAKIRALGSGGVSGD